MISPFAIGFAFAGAEQAIRTVLDQSFRFRPRDLLEGTILECPPFLAFAFLAGVGADWISDISHNHALEALIGTILWIGCLLVRNVLASDLWWLKPNLLARRYTLWRWSIVAIGTLAMLLAVAMYLIWHEATGLTFPFIWIAATAMTFLYVVLLAFYSFRVLIWKREICLSYLSELLHLYCQKSPDNTDRIFRNPTVHSAQNSEYYINKYYVAYSERMAGTHCCCLEEQLIARISSRVVLPTEEIRTIVREIVTTTAREYELEYHVLTFIVAKEPTHTRVKDILQKSCVNGSLPMFHAMRDRVVLEGKLIDTS